MTDLPARLSSKRLLVTGASSGIGASFAIRAAREGARVALVGRDSARLTAVHDSLAGTDHAWYSHDLSDLESIPGLVKRIAEDFGGLDDVVHAAGIHAVRPLRSVSATSIHQMLTANVGAALMIAKGFRLAPLRGRPGSITFMASVAGLVGQAGISEYSASKGAVIALTRSLAVELAREGIRANCVSAGIVDTPMAARIRASVGEAAFNATLGSHPLGPGVVDDVVGALLYLVSDEAKWVTGVNLVVDGGFTAQ